MPKKKYKQKPPSPAFEKAIGQFAEELTKAQQEDLSRDLLMFDAGWNKCKEECLRLLDKNIDTYSHPDAPVLQIEPDLLFVNLDVIDDIKKL